MRLRLARGFTLIELMVVVAIVAIIAAIALPSYNEQVRKSRRSDAIGQLGQLQMSLERWRSENPCYGLSGAGGCPTFTASGTYPSLPDATQSPYYALAIASATPTGYSLTATPRSGSAQADDRCGTYTFAVTAGVLAKSASGGSNCSL
jgi:type IV pilus assembly protein PilE